MMSCHLGNYNKNNTCILHDLLIFHLSFLHNLMRCNEKVLHIDYGNADWEVQNLCYKSISVY